LIDINY